MAFARKGQIIREENLRALRTPEESLQNLVKISGHQEYPMSFQNKQVMTCLRCLTWFFVAAVRHFNKGEGSQSFYHHSTGKQMFLEHWHQANGILLFFVQSDL